MTAAAPVLAQSDALWTIVRASGTVDLVLLTVTLALGVAAVGKGAARSRAPRFLIQMVHRDVSLLAVALLVAHVVAALVLLHLDVVASVVPFTSHVRRIYLGLGVLSAELMVLLAATSLVRLRMGLRQWRRLHWLAYAGWVAAVLHGAAPGTDRNVAWVGLVDIACVAVVAAVAAHRFAHAAPRRAAANIATGLVAVAVVVGFAGWMHASPPVAAPAAASLAPDSSTPQATP
jgi:sulfoxide reductase heme-binding subunit YedZ